MGRGEPPKRGGESDQNTGNGKAGSATASTTHKTQIPGEFKLPTGPQPLMSVGKLGRQQNLVEEAKKPNRTGKCLVFDVQDGNKEGRKGGQNSGNAPGNNLNDNFNKGPDWKQLPGITKPPTDEEKKMNDYDIKSFNIKENDKKDLGWVKGWYLKDHAAGRTRVKMENCELPKDGNSQRHLWEVMW
jgi:hypothetical protein